MRRIIILNEINKATKDALVAFDHGVATDEQKKLVGKHNAGKKASEAIARYRKADDDVVYDIDDESTEGVRKALHNVVNKSKRSDYSATAARYIEDGQDIKQGKSIHMQGLETPKLGSDVDDIEGRAAESHAKIDSMKKSDLAKVRRKWGGKRDGVYNLNTYGNDDTIELRTRTPDGKKVDDQLYTNNYLDNDGTIGKARIKSTNIRSLQQFGKKKKK